MRRNPCELGERARNQTLLPSRRAYVAGPADGHAARTAVPGDSTPADAADAFRPADTEMGRGWRRTSRSPTTGLRSPNKAVGRKFATGGENEFVENMEKQHNFAERFPDSEKIADSLAHGTHLLYGMRVTFAAANTADQFGHLASGSDDINMIRNSFSGDVRTKHGVKKEVVRGAEILVDVQRDLLHQNIAHKFYVHSPEYHVTPVVISVVCGSARGTREQAFDYYGKWGSDTATTTPEIKPFATDRLGEGVRVQRIGQDQQGVYENVNYVWRNEEFDTDILVWMTEADRVRFHEVLPDLDEFVKGIYCCTRPHKES